MLDWEGNMMERRHWKKHIIDYPLEDYDDTVDRAMAGAFTALEIDDPFAHALNEKAEVSKFAALIGSTVAHDDEACPLFLPTFAHLDDLNAEIDVVQASKPSSVTLEFLSKTWNIKSEVAAKTLNQTTHLNQQGAENDLSWQFTTKDCMLRYKRIDSQFFTDTFFVTAKGNFPHSSGLGNCLHH